MYLLSSYTEHRLLSILIIEHCCPILQHSGVPLSFSIHPIQILNWMSLAQIPLTLPQNFKGHQPTLHLQI